MARDGQHFQMLDSDPFASMQVHSVQQCREFFSAWNNRCVPVCLRCENASLGGTPITLLDIIIFDPVRQSTIIVFGLFLTRDARVVLPSVVEAAPADALEAIAVFVKSQLQAASTPEGRVVFSLKAFPYHPSVGWIRTAPVDDCPYRISPPTGCAEPVLPSASRYGDVVHHIKRYVFARDRAGGRRLKCSSAIH